MRLSVERSTPSVMAEFGPFPLFVIAICSSIAFRLRASLAIRSALACSPDLAAS